MKLRETIEIEAAADEIWPFLADPAFWPRWNTRVLRVERSRSGPLIPSEQFDVLFQMKRRQTQTQVDVKEVAPPVRLWMRQHFQNGIRARHLDLTFTVERIRLRTARVSQVIDHAGAGIPFPFRLLIQLVHRFGRPVGTQPLRLLKQLVETGSTAGVAPPRRNAAPAQFR